VLADSLVSRLIGEIIARFRSCRCNNFASTSLRAMIFTESSLSLITRISADRLDLFIALQVDANFFDFCFGVGFSSVDGSTSEYSISSSSVYL
jgi:hypothetical protein